MNALDDLQLTVQDFESLLYELSGECGNAVGLMELSATHTQHLYSQMYPFAIKVMHGDWGSGTWSICLYLYPDFFPLVEAISADPEEAWNTLAANLSAMFYEEVQV